MTLYTLKKSIEFDAAHRLINYVGPCGKLHGHRYKVEFHFETDKLDSSGFVLDFAEVKRIAKTWIDENWDHGTILNENDVLAPFLIEANQKIYLLPYNPTAENMAKYLYDVLSPYWPNLKSIVVWETPTGAGAFVAYT